MVLIDVSNLAYKAWFKRESPDEETCVIHGVLTELLEIRRRLHSNDMVFCFDSPLSNRRKIFPGYKDRKNDMADDVKNSIRRQIDALQGTVFPMMGFKNIFSQPGYEADDIIAKIALDHGSLHKCVIVSSDKDLCQCLSVNVSIYNSGKIITYDSFYKEHGIYSYLWGEVKGFCGCVSDTIPGCPGIGEKTAIKYILNKLPETHAKHKTLSEYEKTNEHVMTLELVTLPLNGCNEFVITTNKFSKQGFFKMCDLLRFDYFKKEKLSEWKDFFRNT